MIFYLLLTFYLNSQSYIRDIYIDNNNIFPDTTNVWLEKALNKFHIETKPYIIEQELLFDSDYALDEKILLESERNLRRLRIFTEVDISYDTVGYDLVDVYVTTIDRWSTTPALLFGFGGGQTNLGIKLEEDNFLGRNYFFAFHLLNRSENDIGYQGRFVFKKQRLFRLNVNLDFDILSNKFINQDTVSLYKPFRNLNDNYAWSLKYIRKNGSDFIFDENIGGNTEKTQLLSVSENNFSAYFSKAWTSEKGRAFLTAYVDANKTNRGLQDFNRAYDNSGKFLLHFSSVSENYSKTSKINYFQDEDIMTGGYGSVVLGRSFPIDSTGDRVWYAGARGEQSWRYDKWYLYLMVAGGSGFDESKAKYTYQESQILSYYRFNHDFLFASRIRQQTAWNWSKDRQLVLDNDYGLRGYDLNAFSGDSRIQTNFELRYFSPLRLWIFDFSFAGFFDSGTTWNQDTGFLNSHLYKSTGLGFRIHNNLSLGPTSVFRFDFAYNIDEKRFGGIIFTTGQAFDVNGIHNFLEPLFFGLDFDGE